MTKFAESMQAQLQNNLKIQKALNQMESKQTLAEAAKRRVSFIQDVTLSHQHSLHSHATECKNRPLYKSIHHVHPDKKDAQRRLHTGNINSFLW